MTKSEAKQLLDALIGLQENHEKLASMYRDEGLYPSCAFVDNEVRIHKGIDILADALCITDVSIRFFSEEYPYEYSFDYRGYRISQIAKEEIPEWKN